MPETAPEYDARIRQHLDDEGRLDLPAGGIPFWDVFPFEAEGLRLKAIAAPLDAEQARFGEDPQDCRCADPAWAEAGVAWSNERWRLHGEPPSGSPLVAVLMPKEHHDLATLPPALAAEMGTLMASTAAAVEALPSVARCHLSRWGDGGAHAHFFFLARPALMGQFRGTCMALWDDFLPPVPQEVRDENLAFVARRLQESIGGSAHV